MKSSADESARKCVQIQYLQNAWESGAWNWNASKRLKFGNDMLNLLAVQGAANQENAELTIIKAFKCYIR